LINLVLLAVQSTVPATPAWNLEVAAVISVSCLLVLVIAVRTVQYPHVGAKMPLGPLGQFFNNPSIGTFIGSMALGHIIGVGILLGLTNLANP